MIVTLSTKEFDEAVFLWLREQGFSNDSYTINTRVIAGRSDGPLGTRIEATIEKKQETIPAPSYKPNQADYEEKNLTSNNQQNEVRKFGMPS